MGFKFVNVLRECVHKKINKYKVGALRAKAAPCARGICIEEVCDARIGMCVHVRVPLMQS